MKIKILVIALILSMGINVGVVITLVQHWRYRKRLEERLPLKSPSWYHSPMRRMLGLSKEQFDAIEKTREEMHSKIMPKREKLRRKRRELMDLLREPEPQKERLDSLLHEVAELQTEIELFIFEDILKMKEILTPEQEERFFELFNKRLKSGGSPRFPHKPGHSPEFKYKRPKRR